LGLKTKAKARKLEWLVLGVITGNKTIRKEHRAEALYIIEMC